ncbi:MAG: Holliday junction branch migration DNA helicase RuvB [Proteobacteria bacterium]|nr:Holliday junction branch migration DNA helicase RuvB [Pseudomonadota bacterium]
MTEPRMIAPQEQQEDSAENSLRPLSLGEFIGQKQAKENLAVFIEAAKKRSEALDHIIFYGPPGLGKTTLAQIIAREMGVSFRATAGPILSKAGDLAAILTNLQAGDVLFIDEIHRMNPMVEEVLYPAMEDFKLDLIIGEGPAARSIRIDLPRFTLVGATTRIGMIANPLRDRFGIPVRLNFYETSELEEVIRRAAAILDLKLTDDGAKEIASRSRGTPRIAVRLLKRVRDFAVVDGAKAVDKKIADGALKRLEVDAMGLDSADRRYMQFIMEHYNGGPVGIETVAAGLSEQRDALEETIEPYLIQRGFLQRTPRGRMLTIAAFKHLGMPVPATVADQLSLMANVDDA